jgi:hypothetical protein
MVEGTSPIIFFTDNAYDEIVQNIGDLKPGFSYYRSR